MLTTDFGCQKCRYYVANTCIMYGLTKNEINSGVNHVYFTKETINVANKAGLNIESNKPLSMSNKCPHSPKVGIIKQGVKNAG